MEDSRPDSPELQVKFNAVVEPPVPPAPAPHDPPPITRQNAVCCEAPDHTLSMLQLAIGFAFLAGLLAGGYISNSSAE